MDDDLVRAIGQHFSECPEWSDDLVEAAVRLYRREAAVEQRMGVFVEGFVANRMWSAE